MDIDPIEIEKILQENKKSLVKIKQKEAEIPTTTNQIIEETKK